MANIVAIIPARGGSKGIPNKNIMDFCGKPLIAWTIEQCLSSGYITDVWVSSDSQDILNISEKYGAKTIKRPDSISGDLASSESAWKHAIEVIQRDNNIDLVFAPQLTSPLRETKDINNAIEYITSSNADSLLSTVEIEDFFIWKKGLDGTPESVNYDYMNRRSRQEIEKKYLENGSFYIFKPQLLKDSNNRLGGKILLYKMEKYKMFQIDNDEDIELATIIMKGFGLDNA
jgi:CMP-N,N'-diacetyllegionaminic acid synthase